MYEDSNDGMLGLKDEASNTINGWMANIHTKRKDVIASAKEATDKQNKIKQDVGDTTTIIPPEFTASGTEAHDEESTHIAWQQDSWEEYYQRHPQVRGWNQDEVGGRL